MSTMIGQRTVERTVSRTDWGLWLRQIRAIMRIEITKNFWGRRALLIYLLAAVPVILMFLLVMVHPEGGKDISRNWASAQEVFGYIYEYLILQTIVFFGCAWIFMNLFRGELVDKSLHYYFLCPLRREVLVAGKYLSGLLASGLLFSLSTIGSLVLLYYARGYPANVNFLFDGPGIWQVFDYIGITLLGCLGYGAVFLFIGLFFRNPIIPALLVYGWEWLNFLLPPVLKKISIVHYLHTLAPVPMSEGPFATVVAPTSPFIAIPSMILFTAAVIVFAGIRIRKMEISYGGE